MARRLDAAEWGIAAGTGIAVIAMVWLTIALLAGPGATAKVLYPVLLFLLPVLALGAVAGWLAGIGVRAAMQLRNRRIV
ncbi:MAG: hypothetical protein ACYDCQ_07965 [Dehalococcoidia bacterium]